MRFEVIPKTEQTLTGRATALAANKSSCDRGTLEYESDVQVPTLERKRSIRCKILLKKRGSFGVGSKKLDFFLCGLPKMGVI